MIVEYCEHGSLKHYLRKQRRGEALYSEGRDITRNTEGTKISDDVVNAKDLMSFSWQISKGMTYLAQMKVGIYVYRCHPQQLRICFDSTGNQTRHKNWLYFQTKWAN